VSAFKDTLTWMRRRDKAASDLRRVEEAQERLSKVTGCNSFAPGTLVLLADGSRRPIEEVRLGDRALATEVSTGRGTSCEVVATIIGQGWKRLVEISVAGQAPIAATDGHPFWVPSQRGWVDADHVYYVTAGATDVLVHNASRGGGDNCGYTPAPESIPGVPGLSPAKPKTGVQAGGGLRKPWKDSKGNIYEWDSQHGELDTYDKRGRHLGPVDPATGNPIAGKGPVPGKTVEP
jgi:hypothetical protein